MVIFEEKTVFPMKPSSRWLTGFRFSRRAITRCDNVMKKKLFFVRHIIIIRQLDCRKHTSLVCEARRTCMCVRLFVSVLNLIRRLNVVHNYYTDYVKRSRVWIDLGSAIVDNRCNKYNDDDDDDDYECVRHVRQFFIEHHDESTGVSGNKFLFPVIGIRFWKRNELRKSVSFQARNWGRGKLSRKKVFSHFTQVCCW